MPPGAYNVVDDEPVTRREIDEALAAAVGVPRLSAPAGDGGVLERSLRVSNRRLRELGGWAPAVHAATAGWRLIAEERAAA